MNPITAMFFALVAVKVVGLVVEMLGSSEHAAALEGPGPALRSRR